jgi:translation initiation factor IF-3
VRFRLKIGVHDYETKAWRAEDSCRAATKVKAMILLPVAKRSRASREQGVRLLQHFAEDVSEFGSVRSVMID